MLTIDLQASASDDAAISPITTLHNGDIMGSPIAPLSPSVESASLGQLCFHLGYDFRSMTLNLKLICADRLPAKDFSGTSDPYVKIMLLPDRKHQLVSNIKRKSLNPRWNEMFAFEGCVLMVFVIVSILELRDQIKTKRTMLHCLFDDLNLQPANDNLKHFYSLQL